MITVHHLSNSHSHVVLWLLEELGCDYRIVRHQRDPQTRLSPQSLRDVHPAAKAPTIEDHGRVMIESTGIILYILEAYGDGRLRPASNTVEAMEFYQWLTYVEGSAKAPLMLSFRARQAGVPAAQKDAQARLRTPMALFEAALEDRDHIAGGDFTAADIQLCFYEELAEGLGELAGYPRMQAHMERMRLRDGYRQAEAKGGPVGFKDLFKASRK